VQAATKVVSEVYKKEYDAAKSPAQKRTLALNLLADADKTINDANGAYAMYQVAQKIAIGLGDVDISVHVGARIAARFEVDAPAEQRKLFEALLETAKTPLDQANLTRYIGLALPPLVKQTRFEEVAALVQLAVEAAKASKDVDLQKYWAWKEQQLTAQAKAWSAAQAALAKLETDPADAEANACIGEYRACWEEDWKAAIPLLALSDAQPWQGLAERELRGTTTEADKLALADSWYDFGSQAMSPVKEAVLRHAGVQYERMLSSLSPLPKRKTEARISEIRDVASPLPKDVWVEVLELVNLHRHTLLGELKREGLALVCRDPNDCKKFRLPLIAEGAYELRIRAVRLGGSEAIHVPLSRSANGCLFGLNCHDGKHSGLQNLDGRNIPNNSSRVAPAPLVENQPYLLTLQVEPKDDKVTIAALVNNRPYFRWAGDRKRLTHDHVDHREHFVIGICSGSGAIYSVQFKRKSGGAWFTD
jgi:hypothetical protein